MAPVCAPPHCWENDAPSILVNTTEQLIQFGFQAIVLLAGHYPWQSILTQHVQPIQENHPDILILWGTEMSICGDDVKLRGDHAAREETSYGLSLFPEFIDMDALQPGRDVSAWPRGNAPSTEKQHPGVCFDPNQSLFGQMGEDARTASAERGEAGIARLVSYLTETINRHLSETSSSRGLL